MVANAQLVKERSISPENVARINNLHRELETCLAESDECLRETPQDVMYHWFEVIEMALQQQSLMLYLNTFGVLGTVTK